MAHRVAHRVAEGLRALLGHALRHADGRDAPRLSAHLRQEKENVGKTLPTIDNILI